MFRACQALVEGRCWSDPLTFCTWYCQVGSGEETRRYQQSACGLVIGLSQRILFACLAVLATMILKMVDESDATTFTSLPIRNESETDTQ